MEKKLLLATLLLILVVIIGFQHEQNPSWAQFQKEYFAQQAALLQKKLNTAQDVKTKEELQQEISDWENRTPQVINLVLPNGQVERCKTCHIGIEEISPSHPSNTLGCTICHGGNALSLDQATAHDHMFGGSHPGSLDVASLSCGVTGPNGEACHSQNSDPAKNEVDLVKSSIMSTKSGELSAVRRTFGLDKTQEVPNLQKGEVASSYPHPLAGMPQEAEFQSSCLNMCHQGGGGKLPVTASGSDHVEKAQGCETCHILTNPEHSYQGSDTAMNGYELGHGMTHQFTTQIPYTQCNQCHNQGLHDPIKMTFIPRSDLAKVILDWGSGDKSWENRFSDYYIPGEAFAKCEVSLDCIDCHTRQDVMGDGKQWTSEYDAVHIQCADCHGTTTQPPLTKTIQGLDDLAFEEKVTNPVFPDLKVGDTILMTQKGEELPFIRKQGQDWIQYSRVTGKNFTIPLVQGSGCLQDPKDQSADSCHKCHDQSSLHP